MHARHTTLRANSRVRDINAALLGTIGEAQRACWSSALVSFHHSQTICCVTCRFGRIAQFYIIYILPSVTSSLNGVEVDAGDDFISKLSLLKKQQLSLIMLSS